MERLYVSKNKGGLHITKSVKAIKMYDYLLRFSEHETPEETHLSRYLKDSFPHENPGKKMSQTLTDGLP